MATKLAHTSYTDKKGYIWRKRYLTKTIDIHLKTHDTAIASVREATLSLRFLELKAANASYEHAKTSLVQVRDLLDREYQLKQLQSRLGFSTAPVSVLNIVPTESMTTEQKIDLSRAQEAEKAITKHTFEEARKVLYLAKGSSWAEGSKADYNSALNKFAEWCAAMNIHYIEDVTRTHIHEFKIFLDEDKAQYAANTKQKFLTRNATMFLQVIQDKEWITKNPFDGTKYRGVEVENVKEEITFEQFDSVMSLDAVKKNQHFFWGMNVMFYTGLRSSEMHQVRSSDYVEVNGVKCLSVNIQDGKTTKNKTSIRTIPLCEELLKMGVWEVKPTISENISKKGMEAAIKEFYAKQGLERTSHCFRHSLSIRMADVGGEDAIRNFILGHAAKTMTDQAYMNRKPVAQMKKVLDAANKRNSEVVNSRMDAVLEAFEGRVA